MSQIRLFSTLDISASGLAAQRARMNVIAQNIANAGSTKTENGEPYRRQVVDLEAVSPGGPQPGAGAMPPVGAASAATAGDALGATPLTTDRDREAALDDETDAALPAGPPVPQPSAVSGGVRVARIRPDDSEFQRIHDPSHPDADAEGYVRLPNVNMVNEMVDMMLAARAYEANLAVMTTSKDLLMRTLTIGKQ